MTRISIHRAGYPWIVVAIGLALLVVENLPTHTTALSANHTDDLASLPVMYD